MRDKTVGDCMTPLESVFMLDVDGVIDQTTMNEVLRHVLYIPLSPSCYQLKWLKQLPKFMN